MKRMYVTEAQREEMIHIIEDRFNMPMKIVLQMVLNKHKRIDAVKILGLSIEMLTSFQNFYGLKVCKIIYEEGDIVCLWHKNKLQRISELKCSCHACILVV